MKALRKICFNMIGLAVILSAGCGSDHTQEAVNDQAAKDQAALQALKRSNDSLEYAFEQTMKEINSSLVSLSDKNKINTAGESKTRADMRQDIHERIRATAELIQQNKDRISKLKKQVSKYHLENTGLQARLEALNTKMVEYEQQLAVLKTQLESKDVEIADLGGKVEKLRLESYMQKEFADKYENDLNTAYYALGSYKELHDSGIIAKKGGVLGMGSTEVINENIPNESFARIDIRKTTVLPVHAKKAKLITSHPAGSYEFNTVDGMIASIDIKNPDQFWKITKHMVIETK